MPVKNRLAALLGEKIKEENRVISKSELATDLGITRQVVHKWLNNDVTRFEDYMIERICRYFKCGVGDLLVIEDDPTLPLNQ